MRVIYSLGLGTADFEDGLDFNDAVKSLPMAVESDVVPQAGSIVLFRTPDGNCSASGTVEYISFDHDLKTARIYLSPNFYPDQTVPSLWRRVLNAWNALRHGVVGAWHELKP